MKFYYQNQLFWTSFINTFLPILGSMSAGPGSSWKRCPNCPGTTRRRGTSSSPTTTDINRQRAPLKIQPDQRGRRGQTRPLVPDLGGGPGLATGLTRGAGFSIDLKSSTIIDRLKMIPRFEKIVRGNQCHYRQGLRNTFVKRVHAGWSCGSKLKKC